MRSARESWHRFDSDAHHIAARDLLGCAALTYRHKDSDVQRIHIQNVAGAGGKTLLDN